LTMLMLVACLLECPTSATRPCAMILSSSKLVVSLRYCGQYAPGPYSEIQGVHLNSFSWEIIWFAEFHNFEE
jgi:hypothetical protein